MTSVAFLPQHGQVRRETAGHPTVSRTASKRRPSVDPQEGPRRMSPPPRTMDLVGAEARRTCLALAAVPAVATTVAPASLGAPGPELRPTPPEADGTQHQVAGADEGQAGSPCAMRC